MRGKNKKKKNTGNRSKKLLLYLFLILSTIFILIKSSGLFMDSFEDRLYPQISRAVVQIARLLPEYERNEEALREAFEQMQESREQVLKTGGYDLTGQFETSENELEDILHETLSWPERVTKLKVGRDGYVFVALSETGEIIAHPEEEYVSGKLAVLSDSNKGLLPILPKKDDVISIEDIDPSVKPESMEFPLVLIGPDMASIQENATGTIREMITEWLRLVSYGSILSYKDTYIICGIPMYELVSYLAWNALFVSAIYLIIGWCFVRYCCLKLDEGIREQDGPSETEKNLRQRLIICALIASVALCLLTLYSRILSDSTNDLKTLEQHAKAAVDTLNTYNDQRKEIAEWLDRQYLMQCRLAAFLVTSKEPEDLTRGDMKSFAAALRVKHVYLFDKEGAVVVTNSPYDHFKLSRNPKDQSYIFRQLLEGADYVIQEPMENQVTGEYTQYIGVSIRDMEDLSNGFVQIAVDPSLRDSLISPLNVDTVVSNLIIGLPESAAAIEKDTLKIVSSTWMGYQGNAKDELRISEDDLQDGYTGVVYIAGEMFYAGFGESEEFYLVPLLRYRGQTDALADALYTGILALIFFLLMVGIALYKYDPQMEMLKDVKAASPDNGQTEKTDNERSNLIFNVSRLVKRSDKKTLDTRWGVKRVPRQERTPEMQMKTVIYRVLLLFCILVLLPNLYVSFYGGETDTLNGVAYVLSGHWTKGFNIFAVTSCIFLLCGMYVTVVLVDQLLYWIARVSDRKVETICFVLKSAINYICVIIFIYYGLAQFGVDTRTLLASAGLLSLIIGLGAKDLVNDIIAGFFIIFEGTVRVGDFIILDGFEGMVQTIGIRTTQVKLYTETKIFNNSSLRDMIRTDREAVRMPIVVSISYSEDIPRVERILDEEMSSITDAVDGIARPPVYEGVVSLGESSVDLRIGLYTDPMKRFSAEREFRRQIKLLFDRNGIEIPFNQLVIHQGDQEDQEQQS